MAEANCDTSELSELFERAADHVKSIAGNLETGQLLELYSYYKQATQGSCNIPKPRWYEMQAKQKWEAWQSLGDMSQETAMKKYTNLVSEIDSGWNESTPKGGWVAVSCLTNTDEYLDDSQKTIFDWVKEGNTKKVWEFVQNSESNIINCQDQDGMGLIHWAADRGNLQMVKCLIKDLNANVDLKDADGQTALHYAVSCGHVDVVEFLLSSGADPSEPDEDGTLPMDVASDSSIVELLQSKLNV